MREQQNRDADDRQIVDAAAAAVANQSVQAACDGVVKDGVVDDPRACRFDPATLLCPGGTAAPGCLSAAQVAVVKKWYDSPRDNRGRELYPGGLPPGSEGGWVGFDINTSPTGLSGGGAFAEQVLRYLAFPTDPGHGGAANRRDCRVHRAEDQPARHYLTQPDVVAGLDQYVDNLIAVCNGV